MVKHDADTIVDNALIVEPELIADTLIDIATVIVIVTVIAIVILTGIVTATAIGIDITDLIHSSISLGLTVTTTLIILTTHDIISLAPTIIADALDGAIGVNDIKEESAVCIADPTHATMGTLIGTSQFWLPLNSFDIIEFDLIAITKCDGP